MKKFNTDGPKGQKDKTMNEILGKLREARAELLEACNDKPDSRACALVLTKIDEAILWQQEDMRLKTPTKNECS